MVQRDFQKKFFWCIIHRVYDGFFKGKQFCAKVWAECILWPPTSAQNSFPLKNPSYTPKKFFGNLVVPSRHPFSEKRLSQIGQLYHREASFLYHRTASPCIAYFVGDLAQPYNNIFAYGIFRLVFRFDLCFKFFLIIQILF